MNNSKHTVFQSRQTIVKKQTENMGVTLDMVFSRHPVYSRLVQELGFTRKDFETVGDLSLLPVTTKSDFISRPEEYRLDSTGLAPEEVAVWDVMHTTGTTTGQPAPFYSTAYDLYKILSIQEGMMQLRGVGSDNLIANLFPLTVWPHGAYARVSDAAAAIKVPVINVLPGNPSRFFEHGSGMEEAIGLIEQNRATILWGVPSYVRRLLIEAADLGADFSAVRFLFITGESAPEALRADLKARLSTLGASEAVISISYGATEMQGGMVECQSDSGFHNPAPDQFHTDIVDPETHQTIPKGERGLVLISHLDRRGTVLLRYSMGDISALASGPCPHCGSETERLTETPVRSDSLIKIKGTLVNPAIIEEILLNEPGVREFQIVIERLNPEDPFSPDHLRLRIAGHEADIVQRVKEAVGVTPGVEIAEPEEVFAAGNTLKSRRVVDTRK